MGPTARRGRPPKVPGEKPTKERILEAAVESFSERGYERTTVRQLAAASGLTESAVYRHFQGKEAILDAILDYVEREVTRPLPFELGEEGCEGGQVFKNLLEGLAEAFVSNPSLVKITRILHTEAPRNEKVRRYLKGAYEERADELTSAMFAPCVERGLLREGDLRGLARVFNSFRYQWCYQVAILDRDAPPDLAELKSELEPTIRFFAKFLEPCENAG